MKRSIAVHIIICSTMIMTLTAFAQAPRWNLILSARDTVYQCLLTEVNDSVLVVSRISVEAIPIELIDILYRHKDGKFWAGAGYGTLAGAAIGAIIGRLSYEEPQRPGLFDLGPGFSTVGGALIGSFAGFAVGGIAGAAASADEHYEIAGMSHHSKIMFLHKLISNQ